MVSTEIIENEINDIYRWWAAKAPGVTPLEEGRLAQLWAWFDANQGE